MLTRKTQSFTAAELSEMKFNPLEFVCHPILVPGATILAGKPKTNKTWLAQELSLAVADGDSACGEWETLKGDVLFFALEDNQRRLQRRLSMLRPNRNWPHSLTFYTESPRLKDGFEEMVKRWSDNCATPRLVVVDTYNFIRPMRAGDRNGYQTDYADSNALSALANEVGASILAIHHMRKMDAEDPLDAISGSTGVAAGFDTVLALSRSAEGNLTLQGRGRDIPPLEIALDFDTVNATWTVEGDPLTARASDERKTILHYLHDAGEAQPKDISEATGLSHDTVRQLLGKMVRCGQVQKPSRGVYGPVHNVHNGHNGPQFVNAVNDVNTPFDKSRIDNSGGLQ